MKHLLLLLFIFTLNAGLYAQDKVGIGTLTPSGQVHILGSADLPQLIIDANSTQSNNKPLIKLRNSLGKDLMWLHSDDSTNCFVGFNAGHVNSPTVSGKNNSFFGANAGYSNTIGTYNSVFGFNSF